VNVGIARQMKDYVAGRNPDFSYGYNYGLSFEGAASKSPDAFREACSGGSVMVFEGAMLDESHSNWRIGAKDLRDAALKIHQNGGLMYAHMHLAQDSAFMPVNDFTVRYYMILNFAATSHIYGGVYPKHPLYLPAQGLYYRFALRYGELLYDEKLRPVKEPAQHLTAMVDGVEHPDLWWRRYTYKRQLDGTYQLITHLVNMPAPDLDKSNSTIDKRPVPLADILLEFADPPTRVLVLDPEEDPWIQEHENVSSLVIPELKSWKIVVQEFAGSCENIPAEVFAEETWAGKDIVPDPENGRVVFPAASFARGEDVTRLVKDDKASFGNALYCEAGPVGEPIHIMDGPRQECASVVAPGRARVIFRLKVAETHSLRPVLELSGPFGTKHVKCNSFERPGVYQDFAYEYDVKEGPSGFMRAMYFGVSDLWIDRIVVEQLDVATDRDRFNAEELALSSLPARSAKTRKAHLVRGLWHDYFGLDGALDRARMTSSNSWEIISSHKTYIPSGFPDTVAQLLEYDLIALLNIAADELRPTNRKNLREYVSRGGTLFVGGGTRAFGHGGYPGTFLAELLPVEGAKLDLEQGAGEAQRIEAPGEHDLTKGVFSTLRPSEDPFSNTLVSEALDVDARNEWFHRMEAKPGATVLLQAGDQPLFTVWEFGRGTVYAMTATPLGDSIEDGTPWWEWEGWQTILDNLLARANGDI